MEFKTLVFFFETLGSSGGYFNFLDSFSDINRQIKEEWTTVPKAMAIIMGGMAGYILGMRRLIFFGTAFGANCKVFKYLILF